MADACLFVDEMDDDDFEKTTAAYGLPFVNVGCGKDSTIRDLAGLVAEVVGYRGKIVWDRSRPDGTPRKLLDVSRLNGLRWSFETDLRRGLRQTYQWYLAATAACQ